MGTDGQPSLSLFQIFFWTVITVWAMIYVYVITGDLLTMTTSMMALLGIADTGSVIARGISSDDQTVRNDRTLDIVAAQTPHSFWQMLATNGKFDLLKLQLFVFTMKVGVYGLWRIANTGSFPDLDSNTLLLLGVSQGVCVGSKLAGSTALARA